MTTIPKAYSVFLPFAVLSVVMGGMDACVWNATHCNCLLENSGALCLEPTNGDGSMSCTVQTCSSDSYKCDCLGSTLCTIDPCTQWNQTMSSPPASLGDTVSCCQESANCVNPVVGQCVHNSTHCNCAVSDGGGICLHPISGSYYGDRNATCKVEECLSGGYSCDCMGGDMCEIQSCSKYKTTTTNLDDLVGSNIACRALDGFTCTWKI